MLTPSSEKNWPGLWVFAISSQLNSFGDMGKSYQYYFHWKHTHSWKRFLGSAGIVIFRIPFCIIFCCVPRCHRWYDLLTRINLTRNNSGKVCEIPTFNMFGIFHCCWAYFWGGDIGCYWRWSGPDKWQPKNENQRQYKRFTFVLSFYIAMGVLKNVFTYRSAYR